MENGGTRKQHGMKHKLVCVIEIDANSVENARGKLHRFREKFPYQTNGMMIHEAPEVLEVLQRLTRSIGADADLDDLPSLHELRDDVTDILADIASTTAYRVTPLPDKWRM
jgi:hypothetical protein